MRLLLPLLLLATTVSAQQPDAQLLQEIRAIKAIDNHSHLEARRDPASLAFPAPGVLGEPEFAYPARLRPDNTEWLRGWEQLYGVKAAAATAAAAEPVLKKKAELAAQRGEGWTASMLDANAIDVALVNAKQPVTGPRFRWVPYAQDLLKPFKDKNAPPPPAMEAWEEEIEEHFEEWKKAGAVAIKLPIAYDRPLNVRRVSEVDAQRIFNARVQGRAALPPVDERTLQDYWLRVVMKEAGKEGLVVHVHTGIGSDPWFDIEGSNPLLLEDLLNEMRDTKVVLVHGSWPFDRQAGAMLIKPNVWVDFSAQTFLRSPRALAETLRGWLEWYPEKVLFGTDAYADPKMPLASWEETLWMSNDSARQALAIALTGMMQDGLVTRARAVEIARMVLRDNARKLYGL